MTDNLLDTMYLILLAWAWFWLQVAGWAAGC